MSKIRTHSPSFNLIMSMMYPVMGDSRFTYNIPVNKVVDYNLAQGVSNPTDLTHTILRNYNIRYITVENSSQSRPVGVAITGSPRTDQLPPINFSLAPGEIRHLGINSMGGPTQYIHILDLETGRYLGDPWAIQNNANQFVLRDGINKFWVQPFKRPSFRG